jgi:hypothetical protein
MQGAKSCLLRISIRSTLAAAGDERQATVKNNAAVMMRRMLRSPAADDDRQKTLGQSLERADHDSSGALCRR